MERVITVRGRLTGPKRIDLDEAVDDVKGEVEVTVLEVIRGLPPGTRSKEDIDRQIAEERDSWGDR